MMEQPSSYQTSLFCSVRLKALYVMDYDKPESKRYNESGIMSRAGLDFATHCNTDLKRAPFYPIVRVGTKRSSQR